MKKLLLLYIFFQFCAIVSNAQIKIVGNISTFGSTDLYPTHIDSLGKGGFMVMPTIGSRDSIPLERRKLGMLVFVQSVDSLYKLNTRNTNRLTSSVDWLTLGLASASGAADSLALKLNFRDTTVMLSNRLKISDTSTMLSNRLKISDTSTMLFNRLKISDTSTMLSSRIARDTVSLSNRIDVLANSTSSDKIKFTKDFPVRLGTMVVSGITIQKTFGKYISGSVVPATGKTLDELLTDVTTEIVHPTYRSPSVSISAIPAAGIVEIGSSFAVALASTFTKNDGGASTATTYKNGTPSGSSLGGNTDNIANITSAQAFSVVIDYAIGDVKNNNLGLSDSVGIVVPGSVSSSLIYTPKPRKYWGAFTSQDIADADLISLSKDWANAKAMASFNIDITSGVKYIFYAYPASFGDLSTISVGGFDSFNAFNKITRNVTNASGYTESYNIYIAKNPSSETISSIIIN